MKLSVSASGTHMPAGTVTATPLWGGLRETTPGLLPDDFINLVLRFALVLFDLSILCVLMSVFVPIIRRAPCPYICVRQQEVCVAVFQIG